MPLPQTPETSARRLLRDEVYTTLHDAIIDGTLEPGEALRDEELTAWLGVSRTPIRQALNRLADIGLVDMIPGRYTRVAEFDAALVNQATYATGILHEYSARTTIPTLTAAALKDLDHYLATAKRAARAEDLTIAGPAIRDYFHVFHRATGNDVLYETVEQLTPVLLRFLTPRSNLRPIDDIIRILEATAEAAHAHDTETATTLIRSLYTDTRKAFLTDHRQALINA